MKNGKGVGTKDSYIDVWQLLTTYQWTSLVFTETRRVQINRSN